MKRRLRILIVFAGVLGLVMALNVGVASAHPDGAEATFEANAGAGGPVGDDDAPVGTRLLTPGPGGPAAPGAINGFNFEFGVGPDFSNPAVIAIANNPLCPLHHAQS